MALLLDESVGQFLFSFPFFPSAKIKKLFLKRDFFFSAIVLLKKIMLILRCGWLVGNFFVSIPTHSELQIAM